MAPDVDRRAADGGLVVPGAPTAAVDAARFRRSVSRFATGVVVVASLDDEDRPHGMTVNSFTSISLEPATVLVSLRPGRTRALIERRGAFGVSVLDGDQEPWSRHFAGRPDPALAVGWGRCARMPVLDAALAWFACEVDRVVPVHDHTLFVARVVDCDHVDGGPLMFFAGRYHRPGAGSRDATAGGRDAAAPRAG